MKGLDMPRGRITPDTDFYDADHDEWDDDEFDADHDEWDDAPDAREVDDFAEFGDEFVYDEHPPVYGEHPTTELPAVTDEPATRTAQDDEPAVYLAPDAEFISDDAQLVPPGPGSIYDYDDFLRTPHKPGRSDQAKRRIRTRLATAGVVCVAAVAVILFVVLGGETDDSSAAADVSAAMPTTTPSAPSTVATAPAAGNVTSGPGVILGFDHAYYASRSGKEAASYLVPSQNNPGTIAALQHDIDSTDPKMKHDIQITSTSSENVYNVLLTLTASDGVPHDYHQQYTVVSQGGRFYIANKLTCESVCPTP